MNTIETSMPPAVIAIGALVSIVLFLAMFRRGLAELPLWARWSITLLRVLLCILVWGLIAQPRAVTERTEESSRVTQVGIDHSQSMSLVDAGGTHTSGWSEDARPGLLDEAIALTEAAKIRLNLLLDLLGESQDKLTQEIAKTGKLLRLAQERTTSFGQESGLSRLSSRAGEDLAAAARSLEEIEIENPAAALTASAKLAAEAALSLRRIAVLHSSQDHELTVDQGTPRYALVNLWLKASTLLFAELREKGEVEMATFESDLWDLSPGEELTMPETSGGQTRLYENLNRLTEGDGTAGRQISILITDGVSSEKAGESHFSAAVRNQPLLVLPIGDIDRSPDVRVESVVSPAQVREKDMFVATVQVAVYNSKPSEVTVNLIENEKILASETVRLKGDGGSQSVTLETLAVRAGQKQMRVEITPRDDEKITYNNRKEIAFSVTKDKYRILVCDAFSRWETRYLQNLFRRDPAIEASSLIFGPHHTYPGQEPVPTPVLPLSLEAWQKFDLVILGDVEPGQLTREHQDSLIEFVNEGGALMILAGRNSMPAAFVGTPLEELLPMTRLQTEDLRGTFVISPSEDRTVDPMVEIANEESRELWKSIYQVMPAYRISPWAKAKQSAQTFLIAHDEASRKKYDFLALQRYGSGRVAFAAAPCFYHLRFRYGDRYHLRFWGEFVRGMCVGDFGFDGGMVKTRLDRKIWEFGEEIQGRVRIENQKEMPVTDARFRAVLSKDGEEVASMIPVPDGSTSGDYFIRFPDLKPGDYQLSYEGGEVGELWDLDRKVLSEPVGCRFWIEDKSVPEEMQFPVSEPVFWSRVNELPLGATIHPKTLGMVLEAIDLEAEDVTVTRSRSIWDTWTILLSIITIAGLEWLLRRIHGLR